MNSMNSMKRFTFVLLMIAALGAIAGAQVTHDPNDRLYRDIDLWTVQGYVKKALPTVRPYPAQVIDKILEDVLEAGNADARVAAQRYRDALSPGRRFVHAGVTGSVVGAGDDASFVGAPFVDGNLRLKDWLTGSFSFYVYGATKDLGSEIAVPGSYSPFADFTSDTADIGPFNLFQDWTSSVAVGTDTLYFQTGLVRSSFGPFFDNGLVVGPQAPKAGHFGLNYTREKWSYEVLWLELVASASDGTKRYPDKHLMSHIVSFRPVPKLELAFFESVVWGGRFDPMYLIPFGEVFAAAAMADNEDNSFMGLHASWNFARNLRLLTQIYIDDAHLNDLMRFKFNSKLKAGAEIGLVWAPEKTILKSLAGDYTAIMPYMYTHMYDSLNEENYDDRYPSQSGYTGPKSNYLEYSHIGRGLGADLDPNSDRVSVRAAFKPLGNFDLSLLGYFSRHGNASQNRIDEGLMDGTYHDGSIHDDGNNDGEWTDANGETHGTADNYDNNYSELRFLTQSVLETKLAVGFGLTWHVPLPPSFGELSLNAEYVAEYGWNRDLVRDNNSLRHYWSLGGAYRW